MTSTDGLLLVDKPAGMTSHDVIYAVRRALGTTRVGHTGTLDPFATGLLVLLLGAATRLAQFVPSAPKVYEAVMQFGTRTDSDDRTGTVVESAPLPDEQAVRAAMAQLTGTVRQVPPAYSAKQVGGRRAYAMARRGQHVELAPVNVHVDSWEVLARTAETWHVRVSCGAGTYVRALARDLGTLAGSAAHLAELRRVAIGPYHVRDAVLLERLDAAAVRPMLDALPTLPRDVLDPDATARVRHGRVAPARVPGDRAALVDQDGVLVAIAERDGDHWQPRVVLGVA